MIEKSRSVYKEITLYDPESYELITTGRQTAIIEKASDLYQPGDILHFFFRATSNQEPLPTIVLANYRARPADLSPLLLSLTGKLTAQELMRAQEQYHPYSGNDPTDWFDENQPALNIGKTASCIVFAPQAYLQCLPQTLKDDLSTKGLIPAFADPNLRSLFIRNICWTHLASAKTPQECKIFLVTNGIVSEDYDTEAIEQFYNTWQ